MTIWWGVIYFVINLILRSILAGMIWEVFIVISENKQEINMKEVRKANELKDIND